MTVGCAAAPPPAPVAAIIPAPPPSAPVAPPPTAATPVAAADPPKLPEPTAIDTKGDFQLKQTGTHDAYDVWNSKTNQRVATVTTRDTVAGGADPTCMTLSPGGHLVQCGNGRGLVWKNWSDQIVACAGVVAPDDASCIEDDKSPFYFQGKTGPAANLDLEWSLATVGGAHTKVATIPRGLNRDGGDPKWWTVQFCSAEKGVIDDSKNHLRFIVDTRTGKTQVQKKPTTPPCP